MVLGLSFRLCKMGLKMLSRLSQESKDGAWERNLLHGHVGVLWLGIRDDQEPVVTDPGEEASWAIRDSDTRLRNRTSRQGDGSHGRGVSRAGKRSEEKLDVRPFINPCRPWKRCQVLL